MTRALARLALAWSLLGSIAHAQSAVEESSVEHTHADSAATKPEAPPAPSVAPPSSAPPALPGNALGRVIEALNPEIGAIVDFVGGWYQDDDGTIKSSDDPQSTGINVQRIELSLQAEVDRWFRAEIYLAIPNLSGITIDEAYLTTTGLPAGLEITAGVFRAGLGLQNPLHLHQLDFTRRPSLAPQLLGVDGMRAPGAEIAWRIPKLKFPLVLTAAIMSVAPAAPDQPLQTFGGGARWDFAYVATARARFAVGGATTIVAGLNYAHGKTSQRVSRNDLVPSTANGLTVYDNYYDNLFGADLLLHWQPANQSRTSLSWQTEYFVRQIPDLIVNSVSHPQTEGALYSQVVVQTHRRWFFGVRGELGGIPSGDNVKREYAGAGSVTLAMSAASRLRLYGEARYAPRFLPLDLSPHPGRATGALFLQLEAGVGSHGAPLY